MAGAAAGPTTRSVSPSSMGQHRLTLRVEEGSKVVHQKIVMRKTEDLPKTLSDVHLLMMSHLGNSARNLPAETRAVIRFDTVEVELTEMALKDAHTHQNIQFAKCVPLQQVSVTLRVSEGEEIINERKVMLTTMDLPAHLTEIDSFFHLHLGKEPRSLKPYVHVLIGTDGNGPSEVQNDEVDHLWKTCPKDILIVKHKPMTKCVAWRPQIPKVVAVFIFLFMLASFWFHGAFREATTSTATTTTMSMPEQVPDPAQELSLFASAHVAVDTSSSMAEKLRMKHMESKFDVQDFRVQVDKIDRMLELKLADYPKNLQDKIQAMCMADEGRFVLDTSAPYSTVGMNAGKGFMTRGHLWVKLTKDGKSKKIAWVLSVITYSLDDVREWVPHEEPIFDYDVVESPEWCVKKVRTGLFSSEDQKYQCGTTTRKSRRQIGVRKWDEPRFTQQAMSIAEINELELYVQAQLRRRAREAVGQAQIEGVATQEEAVGELPPTSIPHRGGPSTDANPEL
mmetsp:Transcript_89973/g.178829  ORF Transcript_89973/g.178829 Transcript_89973/m.178829 type:complete len:508 (+) Transcript_89973:72-1595(+)